MPAVINPFAHPPGTMLSAIQRVGLTSVLCLDAGDINSYNGSSQTWTDASGNSNSFYRGSGSGSDASDPTFNGSAGSQAATAYFSGDGGDAFWQTGSQTFMNAWHKDGAAFAVVGWVFVPTGAAQGPTLLRNFYDASDIGTSITVGSLAGTGRFTLGVVNGSALQSLTPANTDTITENSWMFVALSFSEGSGTSFVRNNNNVELLSSDTYTSPSASNSPNGNSIWASPDNAGTALDTTVAPSSGTRINCLAAFSAFLTQDQVTAIYTMTRGKFGI